MIFLVDWLLAVPITSSMGIPGLGKAITGLIGIFLAVIAGKSIKKFFTFTIIFFIYGFLMMLAPVIVLPAPIKIIAFSFYGLIMDFIVFSFKYRNGGYVLAGSIINVLLILFVVLVSGFLGLPSLSKLLSVLWMLILAHAVFSCIGALLGIKTWNKIKNKNIIRQISS